MAPDNKYSLNNGKYPAGRDRKYNPCNDGIFKIDNKTFFPATMTSVGYVKDGNLYNVLMYSSLK